MSESGRGVPEASWRELVGASRASGPAVAPRLGSAQGGKLAGAGELGAISGPVDQQQDL